MNSFMQEAIKCARKTIKDVPVGAVIVKDNEIISTGWNKKEINNDVTCHAEIIAIRKAEKVLNNWRLEDCDMYVTLEPCPMCGWAIIQSRIKKLYFGSYDNNYGCFSSSIDLRRISNSPLKVYGGICETECDRFLKDFFNRIREKNL